MVNLIMGLPSRLWRAAKKSAQFAIAPRMAWRCRCRAGPFRGLRLPAQAFGSVKAPKLMGTYEAEVLREILPLLGRVGGFVDVGCADGYFLAGVARRHPDLPCRGYDIAPEAVARCRANLDANGLRNAEVRQSRPGEKIDLPAGGQPSLVMLDIEGAEVGFIAQHREEIRGHFLIIEMHPHIPGYQARRVEEPLRASHELRRIDFVPHQRGSLLEDPVGGPAWRRELLSDEMRDASAYWLLASPR